MNTLAQLAHIQTQLHKQKKASELLWYKGTLHGSFYNGITCVFMYAVIASRQLSLAATNVITRVLSIFIY